MFRWYQRAEVCYVYLTDVNCEQNNDFLSSRWWSRAWTLQELLAPAKVLFYDEGWRNIGSKTDMAEAIANRSGIDARALCEAGRIPFRSVAARMSWAAHRQAKRVEDLAYSLLGIFNINMAMQYGEGEQAFVRLQKEILHSTNDMSILAWNFVPRTLEELLCKAHNTAISEGVDIGKLIGRQPHKTIDCDFFAPRPACFAQSHDIRFLRWHSGNAHVKEQHGYLKITAPIFTPPIRGPDTVQNAQLTYPVVLLPCSVSIAPHCLVGILLRKWHGSPIYPDSYRAVRCSVVEGLHACLIRSNHLPKVETAKLKIFPTIALASLNRRNSPAIHRTLLIRFDNMKKYRVEIQPAESTSINWNTDANEPHIFRREDSAWISTNTIVRVCSTTNSLYIGFVNPTSSDQASPPVILSRASEHQVDSTTRLINDCLSKGTSLGTVADRGASRSEHRLYADVVTSFTFNQAVTTLTIVKWDSKLHGKRYDLRPSARSLVEHAWL
ncbi:hypothetical protein EKO04_006554 [Ascochyta lentis]|uniref:DUF8212 domain-containing protein n=1 Tax=Ascochyta lentis TaxID=205686 RepID=A0A8H7MD37_9PLEO|nr:hypothetical protein EKO04_006554 [Ascochyta lentis]